MGQPAIGSCSQDSLEAFKSFSTEIIDSEPAFGKVDEANCSLLRSSQDGYLVGIQQALAAGADINTRLPMWIRIRDDDNSDDETELEAVPTTSLTPLMFASCEGQVEAVELLLRFGAKLDLSDADGMQALHMAAQASSAECFRVLLNAGANPLARDNFGRNPMECLPLSMPYFGPAEQKWPALLKEASLISEMITGVGGVAEAKGEVWKNAGFAGHEQEQKPGLH